ncbi:MAG TPA: GNAT family N-acetyltransferase [Caulobacteraceae bacterium]|nr:GNAT family N-acetyltransferase [Caulobacteraceae bacterium]
MTIRKCRDDERPAIFRIINAAAERYRGAIPAEHWHEPYMSMDQLEREIGLGIVFSGYEEDGELVGVMGIQPMGEVDLIRHAYVLPRRQGAGVGGALLRHLTEASERPILIGTWAAAEWAIAFYLRNGFRLVEREEAQALLRRYWAVPPEQMEVSVVLADR